MDVLALRVRLFLLMNFYCLVQNVLDGDGGTSDFRLTSMTDVEVYDVDNNEIESIKPMSGA